MTALARTSLVLTAVAALSGSGGAQTTSNVPIAQPSSPAPSVASTTSASPSSAPAPVVVQVPNAAAPVAPTQTAVGQIVYTPQLPSAADLTTAAGAQGYTVERIVQTSNQVIAFYRNASGQATTVAYQSLPPSGTAVTPAPAVVVTAPPRTVVYDTAPRVVYYDYPAYYYPPVWYPPVSFSFGFGYRSFHGGHFHRGFRHR